MFGNLGEGFGTLGTQAPGTAGPAAPTAPVLSVVSVVGTTVTLSFVVDETIGEGDYRQVQIQEDGGDWSSTIVDSTAALTSGEAGASELEIDIPEPDAGTYDVRMRVREGDSGPWSGWSNVDEYVIEDSAPVLTFRDIHAAFPAEASITRAVDIGDAAADRVVALVIGTQNGVDVVSVTVAGHSLSLVVAHDDNPQAELWSGVVPTGSGSQDVVVTWASGGGIVRIFATYTMTGLTDTSPKDTSFAEASISVEAGDFLIGGSFAAIGSPIALNWTEAPTTNTLDLDVFDLNAGHLTVASTNAAFSLDADWRNVAANWR